MTGTDLKQVLRGVAHRLVDTPLVFPCYYALEAYHTVRIACLRRPNMSQEDVRNVEQNVTFIFKSFNRQRKARQAYRSICSYYPEVRVIIADDSEVPLELDGAEVVRLPFNSGVSKGIIAALERVETPYVMRFEDDAVLTPRADVHGQLAYLQVHPEVDLCAIQAVTNPEKGAARYRSFSPPRPLIIPPGTWIDGREVVFKGSNWFLAQTESLRRVGYDPNIRMIDHHEFYWRAAGQIVCVQDPHAYAYHCKNPFDWRYRPYRNDYQGDLAYIHAKQLRATHEADVVMRRGNNSPNSNGVLS